MKTGFGIFLCFVASLSLEKVAAYPHVHDSVHRRLMNDGKVNLILTMKKPVPQKVYKQLDSSSGACYGDHSDKIAVVVENMQEFAEKNHESVIKMLEKDCSNCTYDEVTSLWISNQVYIRGACKKVVKKLHHVAELSEVREEFVAPLPRIDLNTNEEASFPTAAEWGIERVNAPNAWKKGVIGKNIRVASIDTGVRASHVDLKSNFMGFQYGWYDPISNATVPFDDVGHGTFAMGTIAAQGGFGVAPGVTWMTCRACDADGCEENFLIKCAQFLTCPFDPQTLEKDCSKAPHVINNSWSDDKGLNYMDAAIDMWLRAGMIPIFANGNMGPLCESVRSPAESTQAITVGATDYDDLLAPFSARGPGINGAVKPDVSAPGVDIVSTSHTNDDAYDLYTGTSAAAPHVTGSIALLLSVAPTLSLAKVKEYLFQGVSTSDLKKLDKSCRGVPNGSVNGFPNNDYGYGLVNIFKSIELYQGPTDIVTNRTTNSMNSTTT